jgi:signal transduction histidine kinase
LVSFALLHNTYVLGRIGLALLLLCYVGVAFLLLKKGHPRLTTLMLLIVYGFIATMVITLWSITAPFGLLIFGFTIVLAGVTLGSSYALVAAGVTLALLTTVQTLVSLQIIHPDRSPVVLEPGYGDVAGFGAAFLILALVSWLSGRQMEHSLDKALTAEAALLEEKRMLAVRLKERTEKLRAAQLKEMQQLYRFAELGQLSTALLHDLANHLTVLTLDIEDLNKSQHSQAIKRAKQSIFYLDRMVDQVRSQLQGSSHIVRFSVTDKIQETINTLGDKLRKNNVQAEVITSKRVQALLCQGDPVRFQQIFTILITNAVDAYKKSQLEINERRILITIKTNHGIIEISVQDWGIGIPKQERQKLFKPFYSTKEDGMGIGLFIAKQMLETHFKGTIAVGDTDLHTEFILTISKAARSVKSET